MLEAECVQSPETAIAEQHGVRLYSEGRGLWDASTMPVWAPMVPHSKKGRKEADCRLQDEIIDATEEKTLVIFTSVGVGRYGVDVCWILLATLKSGVNLQACLYHTRSEDQSLVKVLKGAASVVLQGQRVVPTYFCKKMCVGRSTAPYLDS